MILSLDNHELRGYSVITHLALKIRSSVTKPLLIKHVNRVLPAPSRFPPRLDIKLSSS